MFALPPLRLFFLVLLAGLQPVPSLAQGRGQKPERERADKTAEKAPAKKVDPNAPSRFEALPDDASWRDLFARDARIGFTGRTAADARAALALESVSVEKRCTAWMALGCAGAIGERLELESLARTGEGLERRTAVLALGEMAAGVESLLFELLAAPPDVAECALLALLRTDRASSRRRVEEIASDPKEPLSSSAALLLVFKADPHASHPSRAAALLLNLRWEAARSFGLVDHQNWKVLSIAELTRDAEFLREITLRSAPSLYRPGVKDHLLQELVSGAGPGRLRAAVSAMPRELTQLVENDLWSPKDASEWRVLLTQIDEQRLESLTLEILTRAAEVEELHYEAAVLLARTRRPDQNGLSGLFDANLAALAPADRLLACQAMGASADESFQPRLAELSNDKDAKVRVAALIALAHTGSRSAANDLRGILDDRTHPDHARVIEGLCAVVGEPLAGTLLEDNLRSAEGEEQIDIAIALCAGGHLSARSRVRKALSEDPPPSGTRALRLVHALRLQASSEDREALKELFPLPAGPDADPVARETNIELALALVRLGEPIILPLLRVELWNGSFDRSLLAAGLLTDIGSLRTLRDELRQPPEHATSSDVRRIGFAIGEWGGLREVELLARDLRYNSGDPALQGAILGALSTRTQ